MARMKKDKTPRNGGSARTRCRGRCPPAKKASGGPGGRVFHHAGRRTSRARSNPATAPIIGIPEKSLLAIARCTRRSGRRAGGPRQGQRPQLLHLPGPNQAGRVLLFSYFEYVVLDFQRDMAAMGDEVTKLWWTYTTHSKPAFPARPKASNGKPWKRCSTPIEPKSYGVPSVLSVLFCYRPERTQAMLKNIPPSCLPT